MLFRSVGFQSTKQDGFERSNQINSGRLSTSRIGFKGQEDLGNGLKAIFTLEYGLGMDNNTGIGAAGQARQQFVGLTGGFGTAVAGRLQTTAYDWAVKYDVLAGTAISPLQNVNASGAPFIIGATTAGARADNAFAYISPSFGGVTFAYNRAQLVEESGLRGEKNAIGADMASVTYANGPLSVGGVFTRVNSNANSVALEGVDRTDMGLGASYNFGIAKLGATYQTTKAKNGGLAAPDTNRDKAWSLGAAIPVTAVGNVLVSYAKSTIDSVDAADNVDRKSWTLA